MPANLHHITTINGCEIYISAKPSGSAALGVEIQQLKSIGVGLIVSMLDDKAIQQANLGHEASVCASLFVNFWQLPTTDQSIPSYKKFKELIQRLDKHSTILKKILIHCSAGIGRSGLVALGLMIKNGHRLNDASAIATQARGCGVPQSLSQRKLLAKYEQDPDK